MSKYDESFLLAPFREFYAEVIRLKHMIKTGVWVSSAEAPAAAEDLKPETGTWVYFPDVVVGARAEAESVTEMRALRAPQHPVPQWAQVRPEGNGNNQSLDLAEQSPDADYLKMSRFVWQRLVALFERQATSAWQYGGTYGAEFYREAQYVMVALADEIFLHTEWEGKKVWVSNLLESKIFQSHAAGELFFQKLDRLLVDRDPVYKDLAAVYLMALSLGFKGKYRGSDDSGKLARYRQRLFAFIFRREPQLGQNEKHIFPEAYYHTLREEARKRVPNPKVWVVILCIVIFFYLAGTHGLWMSLTSRLDEVNVRISKIVGELDKKR
jgi:type VI secretion system protein ImpK